MQIPFRPRSWTTWLGVFLAALLIVLGTLQYRWIDRVSAVERIRRQNLLGEAAQRLAADFDSELTRLLSFFQRRSNHTDDIDASLSNSYERWKDDQVYGDLLKEMWRLTFISEDGSRALELERYNPQDRHFETADWPIDMEPIRERFRGVEQADFMAPERNLRPYDGSVPALLVPILPLDERDRRPRFLPEGLVVLVLDEQFIREVFLPELASRHFGIGLGSEFRLWVIDRAEGTVYFQWPDSSEQLVPDRVDVRQPLFSVHMGGPGPPGPGGRPGRGRRMRAVGPSPFGPRPPEGEWELLAVHRAGSLEAAVNDVKFRNLFITTAILLILAASIVVMLTSAQRARELARQQMDFVAGVSHELRTPLTAIRSAAQNLRDGVVSGREEIANYGRIIGKAESRLNAMVMQVLDFARSQSTPRDQLERIDLGQVITEVVEEIGPSLPAGSSLPRIQLQTPLPKVMASRNGLRRILENLIQNAVKYSSDCPEIEIEALARGRHVLFRVKDRGKGIAESELKHVFKPFYRGKGAQENQVQGSGLGLSLVKSIVESFGGRIGVESTPGEGSTFWVQLNRAGEEPG